MVLNERTFREIEYLDGQFQGCPSNSCGDVNDKFQTHGAKGKVTGFIRQNGNDIVEILQSASSDSSSPWRPGKEDRHKRTKGKMKAHYSHIYKEVNKRRGDTARKQEREKREKLNMLSLLGGKDPALAPLKWDTDTRRTWKVLGRPVVQLVVTNPQQLGYSLHL